MSKLKSLEKLRGYTLCKEDNMCTAFWPSDLLADEIQAEVDSRFIELPVDVDGVTIKLGDTIARNDAYIGPIDTLSINKQGDWEFGRNGNTWGFRGDERHYAPRTLEDVLKELACDVRREWVENAPLAEHVYSEYADEIREMLGGAE